MTGTRLKSLEDRQAAAKAGAFEASDWRGPSSVAPTPGTPSVRRPVFGRAKHLHLRAVPASPKEELARARSVVTAACEAVEECIAAAQNGEPMAIGDLIEVVEGVTASLVRDPVALPSITKLRERHTYTYIHSVAVCGLMVALAKEMRFDLATVRDIGLAGLLHDIGKAGIAPELLDKTTALTTSETAILRDHPAAGYEILKDVAGLPPIVLDVCAHHHERPDGLGYPIGIAGEALSVHARMAAICDFYDKMTCPPAGAVKWSPGEAIEHLRSSPGAFDPQIVTTFVRTIGTFLPGVLVRLNSNRLGVVLDDTSTGSLHPTVAVFLDTERRAVTWQRVSTKADPIICIERPELWKLENWAALREQLLALSR